MSVVMMNDPATGRFAIYDEAPGGGDPSDPNSLCNRPLNNPASWLDLIYFHTDLDYMEVINGPTTVTVNHAAVSPAASPPATATINFGLGNGVADTLLLTHNLGYIPQAMVIVNGNVVWPGMPVQVDGSGGSRFVSFYVTTTQVRLYEYSSTGNSTLAATSLDYTVIVFKQPPVPSGNILFDFDTVTGVVQMGKGKFNSLRRYLQVVPGGSPFGVSLGRTIDLSNGAIRAWRPDGNYYEPVPVGLVAYIPRPRAPGGFYGSSYGNDMSYNGSYGNPGAIQVQVP